MVVVRPRKEREWVSSLCCECEACECCAPKWDVTVDELYEAIKNPQPAPIHVVTDVYRYVK